MNLSFKMIGIENKLIFIFIYSQFKDDLAVFKFLFIINSNLRFERLIWI